MNKPIKKAGVFFVLLVLVFSTIFLSGFAVAPPSSVNVSRVNYDALVAGDYDNELVGNNYISTSSCHDTELRKSSAY